MALKLSLVLLSQAILFFTSTIICLADDNADSLSNSQGQPSSDGHQGFSIIVMNTANVWLRISLASNKEEGQDIKFIPTESDTYPLYCQAIPNKITMPISDEGKVDVFIIPTAPEMDNRYCTKCVKMHIVGDLLKPEIAIPSNVSSSCRAKYFAIQISDDPLKKFAHWTNDYTDLKILMAISIDNARGEVSCYGDANLFDLNKSTISFMASNQSFMAGSNHKKYEDGLVVIQGTLGRKISPILDLVQAKCTMCFKPNMNKRNEKKLNDQNKSKRNRGIASVPFCFLLWLCRALSCLLFCSF